MNTIPIAAAKAAMNPREREVPVQAIATRPDETWRPEPNLLTRREIRSIVAEQLG